MTTRLTERAYINTSVQMGGIPGVSGCFESTTMIWEAIQRANQPRTKENPWKLVRLLDERYQKRSKNIKLASEGLLAINKYGLKEKLEVCCLQFMLIPKLLENRISSGGGHCAIK
ncbi:reverse transcriptase [Elysia marginata]|uniref:Reverse transcriptase n=1 Tax=Elysia marginata TaxID=1093978 RepID=A0AAV4GBJ3_9GAST|nr:reverse transcriptase [Elysia marginata]